MIPRGTQKLPPQRLKIKTVAVPYYSVLAFEISHGAHLAVSATVQSAAGSYRARLETGPPLGDTQPVLRHLGRSALRSRVVLRPLEKTKLSAATIMRHYLRRNV